MKRRDLVNAVAKVTQTKKQVAMTLEIFLDNIKKTLKKWDKIFISSLVLLVLSNEKHEKEEILKLEKQSK
jgi:nucleoid DNA-binding protein